MAKTEEMIVKASDVGTLTVPSAIDDFITTDRPEGDGEGPPTHLTRDDIAMPRLTLAQKTSKELEPGESRYIEGLKFTDIFHSRDKRNYSNGPVYVSLLRSYAPRYWLFNPVDRGGGILEKNLHHTDPRCQFTTGADGKSVPPEATKFVDWIVLVLNDFDPLDPMKNVMALSMKSTGLAAAKDLNRLVTFRGKRNLYEGVYKLESGSDRNAKGSFAIWKIANAKWLKTGTPVYTAAAELWESLKGQDVEIEREASVDEVDDAQTSDSNEHVPF